MAVRVHSPYFAKPGGWMKINVHAHTLPEEESPGCPGEVLLREYSKAGYDVVSFTDHDGIRVPAPQEGLARPMVIPGYEKRGKIDVLVIGTASYDRGPTETKEGLQSFLDRQRGAGALLFLANPKGMLTPDGFLEAAAGLEGFAGIEILNGRQAFAAWCGRTAGPGAAAFGVWDSLLSRGRRVWGFGNDGLHGWGEFGSAFNLVKVTGNFTPDSVINAFKEGSFAVSTGVRVKEIFADGRGVNLHVDNNLERKLYIAYGRNGGILTMSYSKDDTYCYLAEGHEGYVRLQVILESGKTLLTQPFFID